jgi:hypothetical protein
MDENQYNNLVVFLQPIKNSAFAEVNNQNNIPQTNAIFTEVPNFYVPGYNPNDIFLTTPPGYFSVPLDNSNAIIMNVAGSNKTQVVTGIVTTIPLNNPIITDGVSPGEGGIVSTNWGLVVKNNAILGYKFDNDAYRATLNSGEWLGKFIKDLINDNNVVLRDYINNQINLFLTTHTHSGVTSGGSNTGIAVQPVTNIVQNTTLNDDVTYINDENYLLNDNAIVVP